MRKVLALTFAFTCINLLAGYASTQNIKQEQIKVDSLKELNKVETDQFKLVDLSNEIAVTYGIISIDSSLVYSKKGIELAKNINYTHGLGVSHSYVARANAQIGEMKVALEHYDNALEIFLSEADSLNILDIYRGMSYVVSYSGNQLASLDYNRKALDIAEKLNDSLSLSIIYNNIATIYIGLDNYQPAIHYFEKTLEIEKKSQNPQDMAITYSNMGILKVKHKKFKEASADYHKITELLPKIKNNYTVAYLYISLAAYYTGINEFELPKQYLSKANEICIKNNYQHILARVYRQYGELFLKEKKYKKSIQYYDKGIELSETIGISEEFPRIYKMKAEAYAQLGEYSKAYKSLQKSNVALNSLESKKVATFLDEFEAQKAKEELNQQKLELALKEQQAENATIKINNRYHIAIITIVLLILLISIVTRFYLKSRQNNQKLRYQHKLINEQKVLLEENIQKLELSESTLQKLNATKDKFFSIIAHDLKSPFSAILGFNEELALNYSDYDDKERKMMIRVVGEAAKSTFSLLENLLTWSRSQSGFIEINKEVHSLKKLVEESISAYVGAAEIKNIHVNNSIADDINILADKETMKIVISNLFNNAVKFSNAGGEINLACKLNNGNVEVCTQDTGIGMSKQIMDGLFQIEKNVQREGTAEEQGTGLGLILCQEFVNKNDGEIWVKSEVGVGSEMYFSLPLYTTN